MMIMRPPQCGRGCGRCHRWRGQVWPRFGTASRACGRAATSSAQQHLGQQAIMADAGESCVQHMDHRNVRMNSSVATFGHVAVNPTNIANGDRPTSQLAPQGRQSRHCQRRRPPLGDRRQLRDSQKRASARPQRQLIWDGWHRHAACHARLRHDGPLIQHQANKPAPKKTKSSAMRRHPDLDRWSIQEIRRIAQRLARCDQLADVHRMVALGGRAHQVVVYKSHVNKITTVMLALRSSIASRARLSTQ